MPAIPPFRPPPPVLISHGLTPDDRLPGPRRNVRSGLCRSQPAPPAARPGQASKGGCLTNLRQPFSIHTAIRELFPIRNSQRVEKLVRQPSSHLGRQKTPETGPAGEKLQTAPSGKFQRAAVRGKADMQVRHRTEGRQPATPPKRPPPLPETEARTTAQPRNRTLQSPTRDTTAYRTAAQEQQKQQEQQEQQTAPASARSDGSPPRDYPHCIRQNFRPAAPHLPDQPETYDRPIRERMPLRHERRERHERCGKAQTGSGAPTHPLRKTENGLRHGILRAAGRSGQSGLSYFSSKTAEPLMSADEAPTSASNTPFSATHSPFVSS